MFNVFYVKWTWLIYEKYLKHVNQYPDIQLHIDLTEKTIGLSKQGFSVVEILYMEEKPWKEVNCIDD